MNDNIQREMHWLTAEIQKWDSYHNHKETMAWLATAFFVTSVITFGFALAHALFVIKVLATIGVSLAFYLMLVFVTMQFRNRWEAADNHIVLMNYISELCCGSVKIPANPSFTLDKDQMYPDHICEFIKKRKDEYPREKPYRIIWRLFLRPRSLDDKWQTELPSYCLMFIALVTSVISLWIYC